ncbi:MAG: transcription-repair coupling factor [Armatimonadetes bacterium]|nr:transcription-repair coupling factor [Armatimonadota bacterium]
MRTADWTRRIFLQDEAGGLHVRPTEGVTEWASLTEEARPALLAASYLQKPRKVLVVTSNYDRCLRWQSKLQLCGVPEIDIHQLPSGLSALFEDANPEHFALSDRIGAIEALAADAPCVVITTAVAVLERTLPKSILQEAFVELKPGMSTEPEKLVRRLARLGYERQEPVRQPGHFSRRGGILDLFAMGRDLPIRIEFFGDEIESIRQFDPTSQRSVGAIPALRLAPSRETLYPKDIAEFGALMRHALEQEAPNLSAEAGKNLEELVESDIEALGKKVYFDRLDLYRPWIHPDAQGAVHLLEETDLLVLEEPSELDAFGARGFEELGQALDARTDRGEILRSFANDFMEPVESLGAFSNVLALTSMNDTPDWLEVEHRRDWGSASLQAYRGNPSALAQTLKNWKKEQLFCIICTDQPNRAKSVLGGADVFPVELPSQADPSDKSDRSDKSNRSIGAAKPTLPPGFYLSHGNLAGGFVFPEQKVAFLTDAEIFGVGRLRLPQKRFLEGAPIATLLDLKPGDYVVHIQFGIGIYRGLAKREVDGVEKEFLYIEYEAPDKLFVPADQLDRVQKYLNPGDAHPKLNRLRGQEWQRTISKAKENARAFAADLVKLYAQRTLIQRRPYGPDTPWQGELESTFPWVETPSQLLAVQQVKCDLRNDFPMDRLVCGDVGFGKTEVAIRAAFKVVQEGRQVSVLCPTTILSEQHFRNFEERMGPFGTKIGLLNRFVKSSRRCETLKEAEAGKLDILIGTHAVLSEGVKFRELGLLVVDEEQKFGVKQKEQIKKLKTAVDVLTLSATPIPRTLSMALMDIRQMSLINDPPPGRLPIRTFLRTYSHEVVREAILRELSRGGQTFFVYNRVEGIYHVAERLRKLVPTARIAVGHGQMHEHELEQVMMAFIHGEVDVLVSTTIVESGLDISNVNTLIVENADRFGLSQLYQLRGRVGRSDRQAYAYFLYQSNREISDQALQRLQALQEFTALGSGYSLAFRDLQIRGAGDLLGAKQHGAMATVGYELYTQLIQEAVAQHKASLLGSLQATRGADAQSAIDDAEAMAAQMEPLPLLDLPVPALLPDSYITDQAQRLYYYQRLMASKDEASLTEAQGEIEDRYGHPPEPARNAFDVMRLRMTMRRLGISKIDGHDGRLSVGFKDRQKVPPMALSLLGKRNRECYLTRDSLIWPVTGSAITATERMLNAYERCLDEVREAAKHD